MKEVVIIEAPGKVGALKNILKSLRRTAEVVATFGSLYDLPKSSLGLDPDRLTPTGWEVANEKALSRLVEA
ncbi:type IA DNA topoisomerase, partial [Pseudomonas aeruginosa]